MSYSVFLPLIAESTLVKMPVKLKGRGTGEFRVCYKRVFIYNEDIGVGSEARQ
jgi:hypothetical protein